MNHQVDFYFTKADQWEKELQRLRTLVLDCELTEELKWGCPCYTFQTNNIVLIHVFKGYCALLFFKGALLEDANHILIQQTKNVQSARQIRFTNVREIEEKTAIIKAYTFEAIAIEKSGLKVKLKPTSEFTMVEEFQSKLKKNLALKTAFEALTPGRQKAYLLYFAQAKQSKTREARIEKSTQPILAGKGLTD